MTGVPGRASGRLRLQPVLSSLRRVAGRRKVTMAQVHRAGETMYVDYAGTTVPVCPPGCEPWDAQIFSAMLGASSYSHAEASRGQDLESWIGSHVRALAFLPAHRRRSCPKI